MMNSDGTSAIDGVVSDIEVTVPELLRRRAGTSLQLIDVREQEEWDEGRIPGSRLIPMSELAERFAEIDPALPVVTVCRVGARSLSVAEALLSAGYRDVRSLAGGLNAWIAAGQPIENSSVAPKRSRSSYSA